MKRASVEELPTPDNFGGAEHLRVFDNNTRIGINFDGNVLELFVQTFFNDNWQTINFKLEVIFFVKIFVYGYAEENFSTTTSSNSDPTNADEAFFIIFQKFAQ